MENSIFGAETTFEADIHPNLNYDLIGRCFEVDAWF